MANETTASVLSPWIKTEIIQNGVINAHLPKSVMMQRIHFDNISGLNTAKKRYIKNGDLGAASAGTEGTALSSNTPFTMGTSVDATPVEGVAILSQLTENAASLAMGVPFEQIQRVFIDDSSDAIVSMMEPILHRHVPMAMQKAEADTLALMTSLANSVGTTTVNLSIADLLSARHQLITQQPLRSILEAEYMLAPIQIADANTEALTASGGLGGSLWTQQAQYGIANVTDDMGFGYVGNFLGSKVYGYDYELTVTANSGADAVGVFGILGRPDVAPDAPEMQGNPGAYAFVEKAPLLTRAHVNLLLRAIDIVTTWHYIPIELVDGNAVKIVTDL